LRAAVLRRPGEPLSIEDGIEIPALRRGQVLVRMLFSGVCHSQLMEASGARGHDPHLPHLLGHEGTGEVVDVGEGVRKIAVGDRVILGWIKGEGLDAGGSQYRRGEEVINSGAVTTFNEFSVVSENRCVKLPAKVPPDVGVLFGCAVPTGAGIVMNTVRPAPGSSIAIIGLGGIGLSALAATAMFQCETIIAIDIDPDKLRLARQLGATHSVDVRVENPLERVREYTAGVGVDHSIEASGSARNIELAFSMVRKNGGRCVFASHPAAHERICLDPFDLICGKRIEGSWGGESRPDRDVPLYAENYLAGRLPLREFLTKRYSLERINDAMDDLANRRVIRALVEIGTP
jgi:S-(hydroxymethyl)glutathione dehydrogenase/alcohol dehydrogenase